MEPIDMDKAIEIAISLVRDAHAEHKLTQLTKGKVRQQVEQVLHLEVGALEEKRYKKRIGEAVEKTVEQLKSEKNASDGERKESRGSDAKPSSASKQRKIMDAQATEVTRSELRSSGVPDSTHTDDDRNVEVNPPPRSYASGNTKKEENLGKAKAPKKETSKPKDDRKGANYGEKKDNFKSNEIVLSDNEGENTQSNLPVSAASTSSSKKKGRRPVISDSEDQAGSSTSRKRRRKSEDGSSKAEKKSVSIVKETSPMDVSKESKQVKAITDPASESESELSVLWDDPPSKKGKALKKTNSKKGSEKKARSKKESKDLSPDDEQIKKLKSLVVACGVRKIWSKELKDCETPSSQISHLRKLLTELGMKGRFSLEQAKTIKAKRDLEKEMEDVQEFAQRHAGDRPRRPSEQEKSDVVVSSDEEDEAAPSRRPKTAHLSIMSFLGDQSDSD